jgi:uncharacterized protein involved in outer membrane biogenesis
MFLIRLVGRFVGFAFKAVVFVAAIGTVAAGVMVALFDADQYKRQVAQRVVDLTGRVVSIDNAELQLSLPPRVVLNGVRLKNAPWGSRPDMARVNRVTVKLDPLAAISGGNSVAEVNLEGADILLETSAAGEANWSALAAAAGAGIGALSVLAQSAAVPAAPVTLTDATVTIRDAAGHANTLSLGGSSPFGLGGSSSPTYLAAAGPGPCDKDDPAENLAATPAPRQTATGTPRKN